MISPINLPIGLLSPVQNPVSNAASNKPEVPESEFSKYLNNALDKLNNVQKEADQATFQLATGEAQDIHNVMLALEKANLNFSLAVEVRNKAIDAYHEMMRMQI